MLIEFLEPDFIFENDKGTLTQLVHDGYKQVNFITSKAGSVRGGHCHRFNDEGFYIISGHITLRVRKEEREEKYRMGAGTMFKIPREVFHTFKFDEDTALISLYSEGVELTEHEKDIWTS